MFSGYLWTQSCSVSSYTGEQDICKFPALLSPGGSCLLSDRRGLDDGRQRTFACLELGPEEWIVWLPPTQEPAEPLSGSRTFRTQEKSQKDYFEQGNLQFFKIYEKFNSCFCQYPGQELGSVGHLVTLLRSITQDFLLN